MQGVSINCSIATLEEGPLALEANSDIAGIGVLIGFTFSAVMTLVLVVIHYIFEEHHNKNLVDRSWIKLITPRSWSEISIPARKKLIQATRSALLTYSDIQAITGIAILLAGYLQLPNGIQLYHWQVLTNLAWFSSVTHIATLTTLRVHFKKRRKLAYCRITAMGINLILLGVASGPANYQSNTTRFYAFPAKCLYQHLYIYGRFEYEVWLDYETVAVSLLFMITSYTIRAIRISVTCSRVTHDFLRVKPGNWLKRNHSKTADRQTMSQNAAQKILWCFWKRQLTLSYVVFKALCEAGDSMLWEIIWLLTALGFGGTKLVLRRKMVNLNEEHVWGFGQVLSVFLSILPLWSIFSAIYEIREMEPITIDLEASTLEETEIEPFPVIFRSPEVFESQWFLQILTLMFTMAIIQIIRVLMILAPSISQNDGHFEIALILFLIRLIIYIGIIVSFAIVCLYTHFYVFPFIFLIPRQISINQRFLWAMWTFCSTGCLIVPEIFLYSFL